MVFRGDSEPLPVMHVTLRHDGLFLDPDTPDIRVGDFRITRTDVTHWGWPSDTTVSIPSPPAAGVMRTVEFQVDARPVPNLLRARAAGGAWSPWATMSGVDWVSTLTEHIEVSFHETEVYDLRIMSSAEPIDDPNLNLPRTARIGLSGVPVVAGLPPTASVTAADVVRQFTDATLGASWHDESGVFVYRGRHEMRGGAGSRGNIFATDVADIPWQVSGDDVADRVEVSFQPPVINHGAASDVTIWESVESMRIAPGQIITVIADIVGAASDLEEWIPIWNPLPAGRLSRWSASPQPDGGGTRPPDTALAITSRLLSPSRAEIRIRNTTAGVLYTGSGDQTAQLILRSRFHARPGETETVSVGALPENARAPLTIDCGSWVQDAGTALEMTQWLTASTSAPMPTLTGVECVPDLNIRMGDVRVLRDPVHTGIASKVLVTGVQLSGSAGTLTQTLDLALLAVTFADLDRILAGKTFGDLDAMWDGMTFADLDHWITMEGIPS